MDRWEKVVTVWGATTAIVTLGGTIYIVRDTIGKLGSNRDKIDTEKAFNIVLEKTPYAVSVVKIKNYSDFKGNSVEFETEDGLRILTSVENCSLDKKKSYEDALYDASLLANKDTSKVISYDELQGNDTSLDQKKWNKRLLNFDYNFDKAILIEEDGTIVVYDIVKWKDWEDDDKVQFTTKDGSVKLSSFKKVRFIDTSKAKKGALESYLTSLIIDQERINYYDETKNEEKAKTLSKTI